jgi:hypothetical protein
MYDRRPKNGSARKRFMNPMEWLKAVYGALGAKYPTLSLLVAMLIGAILAAAVWKVAANQYQKDINKTQPVKAAVPTKSGNATTASPESPAVTGTDNTIIYDRQPPESKKPKPKPK